jgi:dimethylargininase
MTVPGGAHTSGRRRLVALTREVSPAIVRCELTHVAREPIDVVRARAQHAAYEACLARCGCEIVRLPASADLPDSVFVEDVAVVFDEVAVVTRPGAESRRPETSRVGDTLERYRKVFRIEPPGTLDGGDVLCVGRTVHVGRSRRSNDEGIRQLGGHLAPFGYSVRPAAIDGCLHLKSAVTLIHPRVALLNRAWVDPAQFDVDHVIDVDEEEPSAANALLAGGHVIHPATHARTRRRLEAFGIDVIPVDVSEIIKAEGGVTCCSLVFAATPGTPAWRE